MKFRCPEAKVLHTARLKNYQFLINPKGVASVQPEPGGWVEGLLWELTPTCETSLDFYEGVEEGHYIKTWLPVEIAGSTHLEISQALIYIGTEQIPGELVLDGYFEKILRAAKVAGLSSAYIDELEQYEKRCQRLSLSAGKK